MTGYDLTIAIVSYRTLDLARACADSIHTGELRARVVIVETGHQQPATLTPPPCTSARTTMFFVPGLGYAKAIERAFIGTRSSFLIACNADVVFPAESIEPLIDLFDQHSRLALIGPRQVSPGGQIVHAGILDAGSPGGGRSYGEPDIGQYKTELETIPQVSGSVMILRAQAYREVGGMQRMPHLYFEDAILALRLRHAGWQVGYSGLLTFTHHVAASPQPPPGRAAFAAEGRQAFERELALNGVRPAG